MEGERGAAFLTLPLAGRVAGRREGSSFGAKPLPAGGGLSRGTAKHPYVIALGSAVVLSLDAASLRAFGCPLLCPSCVSSFEDVSWCSNNREPLPMKLPAGASYEASLSAISAGRSPPGFNIGDAVSDAWAAGHPDRVCLQHFSPDGPPLSLTYGELAARSDAFRQCAVPLRRQSRATASRSCCRRASRRSSPMWRSTSSAPLPCRWRCFSAPMRWNTG